MQFPVAVHREQALVWRPVLALAATADLQDDRMVVRVLVEEGSQHSTVACFYLGRKIAR